MSFGSLAFDTRHSLRRLARDWRFSTATVLILGLGIGANTAIFSLVDAVLWREAPRAGLDRVVDIYQRNANPGGIDASSYPAYLDMSQLTDVFGSVTAALVPLGMSFLHEGALRPATVEHTTATYLTVLGLRPSLGRWFTAAEDARDAPVVAVLGHRAWTSRFGADPRVVGRVVRIEGTPVTIVGVGPAGHNATVDVGIVTDFWVPISALTALVPGVPNALQRRPDEAPFLVKARLRDGVSLAQAQAAMDVLGRRLASEYPAEDPGRGIRVLASREVRIHPQLDGPIKAMASIVLATFALVLAVACSNLATLLMVRGASRAKEIGVRLALGARRSQLVAQLLTESLVLSSAGGVAGCVLAWWGVRWLRSIELPVAFDLALDGHVLAFAIAVAVLTGVTCGLAPALRATRVDLVPALRGLDAGHPLDSRRFTLKNALIVFQVSTSVLLLGAASLFLQAVHASRAREVGHAVDGVAMLETDGRFVGYTAEQARSVLEELVRRIAAVPGVESVTLTRGLPLRMTGRRVLVDESASDKESPVAGMIWAGPGYFETLRIPLLYGRVFDAHDRADTSRVAVISETMARLYFGAADPVGRRFRLATDPRSWMEVIGVVRDTRTDLADPVPQVFYCPIEQHDAPPTTVVARTSLGAAGLLAAMLSELRGVDATLPVVAAKTMARDLEDSLRAWKAVSLCLAALGALGLLLAGIGLYAVVAFAVSQRSREIGIRMALGARSLHVVWSVTRGVAGLVGVGAALGLASSVLATLALRAAHAPAPGLDLYRPSLDPGALLAIAAVMGLVGVAAALVPARRAALTDPLVALRHD